MELTQAEIRILGCLVEKQRTTPDVYPLTINSLRLACNQSTNRDPVVDFEESTVRQALERLSRRRWVRLTSGAGSRTAKYRHVLNEALELAKPELAVLAVLMLRGPQTPGELRARTERLHPFADAHELRAAVDELIRRGLVARMDRRPGQKEERYAHLLGEDEPLTPAAAAVVEAGGRVSAPGGSDEERGAPGLAERVDRLEAELAELRTLVQDLRSELGGAD